MKTVFSIAFIVVVGVLLVETVMSYLNLPVVRMSYPSGECVKVFQYGTHQYDCHNLPEKYLIEWVGEQQ